MCAGKVSLYIGFSFSELDYDNDRDGFNVQRKITPTNVNHELVQTLLAIFRKNWRGEAVRCIGVSYSELVPDHSMQLNILEDPELQIKRYKLDHVVDKLRKKYGFSAVVKASSLSQGATAIQRSKLVGGHNGGNAYE